MAVSTSYSPLSYNGNSSTTAFSVTWPFFTGSLVVTAIDADGVETVKTITTHYTVSGGTDANGLPATGTVTMLTAPATGTTLRIARVTPRTQATVFLNGDAFPAKAVEAIADRLMLITQETAAGGSDEITGDVMQLDGSGATDFWDGESHPIRNVADGTEADDAITKAQLDAAVLGTTYFTQSGTGASNRTWLAKLREVELSVTDFGATGDGSTDDTVAFQRAIDEIEARGGGAVIVPYADSGYLCGALTVTDKCLIQGRGPESGAPTIKLKASTAIWLTVQASHVAVDNMVFTQGGNLSTALILLDTDTATIERFHFTRLDCDKLAAPLIIDGDHISNTFDELYVQHILLRQHAAQAVVLRDGYAFTYLDDIAVDVNSSAAPDKTYFDVQSSSGVMVERCEVSGTAWSISTSSSQVAFDFRSCSSVRMSKCFADSTGGKGFYFNGCTNALVDELTASQCDGIGIEFVDCDYLQANQLNARGRSAGYGSNKTANIDGIKFSGGCTNASISNVFATNCTGSGINYDHATANQFHTINGIYSTANARYGIETTGTSGSPSVTITGGLLAGNTLGDYSMANMGAGSGFEYLNAILLSSGAMLTQGGAAPAFTTPLPIASGGTAAVTATAAFNGLSPSTTRGDIIVHDGSNDIRLAVGGADTFLGADGTDPSWRTAAQVRTSLGLVIGTNVQAYDADLTSWAGIAPSAKQDALGYTPINKGGDTGISELSMTTGQLINFYKSGGAITGIKANSGSAYMEFYAGSGGELRAFIDYSTGLFGPGANNAYDLGSASYQWQDCFLINAPTVSSDQRFKTDISDCPLGLEFLRRLRPVSFRWKDTPEHVVVGHGEDGMPVTETRQKPGTRFHTGLLAQDVKAALPPGFNWAGWALVDKNDPDSRQMMRPDELIGPIIKALLELDAGAPRPALSADPADYTARKTQRLLEASHVIQGDAEGMSEAEARSVFPLIAAGIGIIAADLAAVARAVVDEHVAAARSQYDTERARLLAEART